MIRQSDIKEIKKLYSDMFGIELNNDTAYLKLTLLLRQVELTHNPPNTVEEMSKKLTSRKSERKNEK